MSVDPMDQNFPIIEDKSSRSVNTQPRSQPSPSLDWWDLLPLVQDSQYTPERAIHWTASGIVTAHPTKPILLLYPQPPSTSERKVFPSDRRISGSDAFGPARVLSASESGEYVFAYFPLANGSNSGAWCIWVNMLLRQFCTVEQGEAVIDCWWLGSPRQRIINRSGNSIRLPQLGPRIAYHSPAALLLSENFTLHLICEPSMNSPPDGPLYITTANALKATANASSRPSPGLDPYTGFICTRAALGLAYSDSSIVIAMQAALLPPPCLPLSDAQPMGLSVPPTTFLTHANSDDWEYTGPEPTVRLCEVTVTFTNKRGWDMQTQPILSVPIPSSSHLAHLHFIPKCPKNDAVVVTDRVQAGYGQYLVVGTVHFGTYISLPETSLTVYLLQKETGSSDSINKWKICLEAKRMFDGHAALSMSTARPSHETQTGLVLSLAGLATPFSSNIPDKLQTLHIPSLQNDDAYAALDLQGSSAPAAFAISSLGDRLVSQSVKSTKEFRFHSYPARENANSTMKWREELIHRFLSSRDGYDIHKRVSASNRESQLDLIDSTWEILDSESGGGGPARWTLQYLQELLLVDMSFSGDVNHEGLYKRRMITLDFLSLPVAKGALVACHGKELDGPYDTDCIWPLSEICGWIMEFSESVLAAAGEYVNVVKSENSGDPVSQSINLRLLILFQPALLNTWVEALTLVNQFLKHVDGPKGSSNDNKVLVSKAIEDAVDQSPINLSSLLEALKTLSTRQFPLSLEWRKAYRTSQISGSLVQSMTSAVELLVVPDIVSLLPLHIRMAGLNLLPNGDARQERDIITKKPLIQIEPRTLGYGIRASCSQCHGKTMIDFSTPLGTSRWQRWEASFQRCICGGRWKLSA